MNKRFRLTRSIDFKRVRKQGQSFVHPLVVLVMGSDTTSEPKIGLSVSKSVGNAVVRNHTKRIFREILRPLLPKIRLNSEFVLVARGPIPTASYTEVASAVVSLLSKSRLLLEDTDWQARP